MDVLEAQACLQLHSLPSLGDIPLARLFLETVVPLKFGMPLWQTGAHRVWITRQSAVHSRFKKAASPAPTLRKSMSSCVLWMKLGPT